MAPNRDSTPIPFCLSVSTRVSKVLVYPAPDCPAGLSILGKDGVDAKNAADSHPSSLLGRRKGHEEFWFILPRVDL